MLIDEGDCGMNQLKNQEIETNKMNMPGILDAAALSRILPFSEATIRADISRRPHLLPPFIKVGTRTVWLRETVLQWLKDKERTFTPPPQLPSKRRGAPTKAERLAKAARKDK